MEFDHAVVVVHDQMDQAVERFRAMGFFVTERGHHSLGTINHLIILDNSYIELLGYLHGQLPAQKRRAAISHRAALYASLRRVAA